MKPLDKQYRYQCTCGDNKNLSMYWNQWYCPKCLMEEIINKDR